MRRENNMGHAFVLLVSLVTLNASLHAKDQIIADEIELEQVQVPAPALKGPPSDQPPMFDPSMQQNGMPQMPQGMPQAPQMMPQGMPQGMPPSFNPNPSAPTGQGIQPPETGPRDQNMRFDPTQKGPGMQKGGRPSLRDQGMGMPPMGRAPNNKPNGKASSPDDDITKVVPQTCKPAKGKFVWNFEEEKLMNILRQVSDLLCMSIVVNDSIADSVKMTIIGKTPMTPQVAKDVLVASMASKGLILVKRGEYWTVEKKADAKSIPSPIYENGNQARNNEEIGTLFYKAKHASPDELKATSKLLISRDGLAEVIGDQFLMIIDTNANIRRLANIFDQIDVEDAMNKIHTIKLHHADTKTVERQLKELFDIQSGARGRRRRSTPGEGRSVLNVDKIIADERTNSLIVVADKDSVDKLKEVVALIDSSDNEKGNKGKIHVKKLKFADAKKIADTLSAVVQQGRGNRYTRRRDDDTNELFEGEVKITAHENTNTLVTVASANDYRALSATIDALDQRKEQVYVEAAILDIDVKDTQSLGINLFGGLGGVIPGMGDSLGVVANPGGKSMVEVMSKHLTTNSTAADGALGSNSIGALAVLGNFLSGGVAGLVGPSISKTSKIPSFGAVLQALSENSNVDVLSTPYLLTTDNQEAVMAVGEKVPVLKGASSISSGLGGGLGIPMQNVAYENVELTFKITPHVGADNNVRLDISQEVNELGTKHNILGQDQHSIRTKRATTTLVLKDQQTGVIGGLISHKNSRTDNKVPFLGDIPIFGWLFKKRDTESQKRSLLLIITPYVIKTDDDYRKILDRKLKEREEFARLYYGGKIKNYNPHIEYDRKSGPLSTLLLQMDVEMQKPENGGTSSEDKTVISPKEQEEPADEAKDKLDKGISIRPTFKGSGASGVEVNVEPPIYDEFEDGFHFDGMPDTGSDG